MASAYRDEVSTSFNPELTPEETQSSSVSPLLCLKEHFFIHTVHYILHFKSKVRDERFYFHYIYILVYILTSTLYQP